jgi:uncharacterized protein YjbJ (UPF0337 family)
VAAGDTRAGAASLGERQAPRTVSFQSGRVDPNPAPSRQDVTIRRKQMNPSTKAEIKGNLDEVKGKVKETAGKVTNNPSLETQGKAEKNAGKVEKKVGQIEKVFEK